MWLVGMGVNGRLLGRRPVAVYHMVGGLIGHNRITICKSAGALKVRRGFALLLGTGEEEGKHGGFGWRQEDEREREREQWQW